MISIGGNSDLSRKIIRSSEWDNAQRNVKTVETVHDFVDSAVTAASRNHVDPFLRRPRREVGCVSSLERRVQLDMMAFLANPVHEMPNVRTVCAAAVDDQRDVLGSHAIY